MNKKGFTLIEVLAVVILLGVIALIAVPTVRKMVKDSKQKLYDEQTNLIEDGLKNWANANVFILPEENKTIKLSLGQLKQAGFANTKINNPTNGKCFSNESILNITRHNNNHIYEVEKIIDVDCDLIEDTPTIKLNGSVVEYLKIGDTYVDEGATAKDSDGKDITSNIVTTITGSGTSIDTTKEGAYTITYSVTYNDKTMTAIRNVFVDYYTNGIMQSTSNCINEGICLNGTEVKVAVNNTEKYKFYVISDINDKLTLIMDRNLGETVAWISKADFGDTNPNGTLCEYDGVTYDACNSKGPLTALKALKERTANWTNIEKYSYTLEDESDIFASEYGYETVTGVLVENVTARLLTYSEAVSLGCVFGETVCPIWLHANLENNDDYHGFGYWLSTASSGHPFDGWAIYYGGDLGGNDPNYNFEDYIHDQDYVSYSQYNGLRPVITLSK